MFSKQECYRARSHIEQLALLQNGTLAISTKVHGIRTFSHESCSSLKNLSIDLLGHQTTAVAFSSESNLFAFANNRIIYIYDTQNKTHLQTIQTNDGEIEILSFVPNTKYLVAGTKNGRVMQYRYDGRSHLSRLCSYGQSDKKEKLHLKNNYVSAFAFYGSLFASSGYGGTITILKMSSYTNRVSIHESKVRISKLCFLDNSHLLSGNIEGFVQIHSLKKDKVLKTIPMPFREINSLVLMPDSRYLLVSGQSKSIVLVDTHLQKVLSSAYLTFNEYVEHLAVSQNKELFVALANGEVLKIKLPTAQELKTLLFNGELDKAFLLIEKDPMLQGTREHKRVEVMYEKLYAQAIDALINANTLEAKKLMQMFANIPSKQQEVSSIFKAFEFYPKFKTLYLEKKYTFAYAIAHNHPALKRTFYYKKMEELFKEAFTFAQKQILMGRDDLAREILASYSGVASKKAIIKLILNQNNDFLEFLKAINEKNYPQIEKLLKRNEIFSQIPTFTALKHSTQNSLNSIREHINKGEVSTAKELIKSLRATHSIKEELQELYRDCNSVAKLQMHYEKNEFKSCYEIIDSNYNLDNLELTTLLEKHWTKIINQCEEAALKGDIKQIKSLLGELIGIKSRLDKIGDLLRLSFYIKIKALMAKRNFKSAENIIYSYIDIFGRDSEILAIMRLYEKTTKKRLAFTINQENYVARNNWINSPLIMG